MRITHSINEMGAKQACGVIFESEGVIFLCAFQENEWTFEGFGTQEAVLEYCEENFFEWSDEKFYWSSFEKNFMADAP